MKDRPGLEPIFLRVSYNLKAAIRCDAGEQGTSINAYIVEAVRARLNESRPAPKWSGVVEELAARVEALETKMG